MRFGRLPDIVEVLEIGRVDCLLLRVTYAIFGGQSRKERTWLAFQVEEFQATFDLQYY